MSGQVQCPRCDGLWDLHLDPCSLCNGLRLVPRDQAASWLLVNPSQVDQMPFEYWDGAKWQDLP